MSKPYPTKTVVVVVADAAVVVVVVVVVLALALVLLVVVVVVVVVPLTTFPVQFVFQNTSCTWCATIARAGSCGTTLLLGKSLSELVSAKFVTPIIPRSY